MEPVREALSGMEASTAEMFAICATETADGVRRLRSLFQTGAAHPASRRVDGDTPLHVAAASGASQVCARARLLPFAPEAS